MARDEGALVNWFLRSLPRARGRSLRRARLLVQFGFGFGVYCIAFVPILLFVSAPEAAVGTGTGSVLMLLSPLVLRWTGSVRISSIVLVAAIVGLFSCTTLTLGGLNSPTTPCLAIAPIVALFLLGPRSGGLWTVIVIGLAGALFWFEETQSPLPLLVNPSALPLLDFAGFVTVVGVSLVFLLNYDSAQQAALLRVTRFNRRMVTMISHLEATGDALGRSAAEFYGSTGALAARIDEQASRMSIDEQASRMSIDEQASRASFDRASLGLTQQLLHATSSGREMIGSVDDSIRGMIEQYKVISKRIAELHQQSGIIADMVSTIDSISNRLDLMALNTGIEAEHVGVHGKNFKLLADDMRRLAVRVLDETARIKSSIELVQKHTTTATNASRTGQILTDESVSKLDLMSTTFDEIYALVERTAAASRQLTDDTGAQLATIYDLVNAGLQASERGE